MNPSCIVQERTHGGGYICASPESHEGYVHAHGITEAVGAVRAWRQDEGERVYDADGDVVTEVSARIPDEGMVTYAYGEDALSSNAHVTYLLVPEIRVSPEEVEAAIESIRKTTI